MSQPTTRTATCRRTRARREGADVDESGSEREGARVGGATGPVEDDEMKAPDPDDTPSAARWRVAGRRAAGGRHAGGRAERPGHRARSHEPGTSRGEDRA